MVVKDKKRKTIIMLGNRHRPSETSLGEQLPEVTTVCCFPRTNRL
jgi:hypothetical protein